MFRSVTYSIIAITFFGLVAQSALASNLRWLDYSPVRFFTDKDWSLATQAARTALNDSKDGVTVSWENPASKSHGSLTPLSTRKTDDGVTCRNLKIENHANGMSSGSTYEFCQKPDGKWAASQGRPVALDLSYQEDPAESAGDSNLTTLPQSQSLGDKCSQMSRQIDDLKGKPQRRSAMMERYRAECQ